MYTGTPTENLKLPQWNPTDHPDFLTDINGAFQKIDENAGALKEEVSGYPKRLEELETLTQSLNEDTQQLIGEMSSAQVAISNLQTASDGIGPMQKQIQGLQMSMGQISASIRSINVFHGSFVWSGTLELTSDNSSNVDLKVARRDGNILTLLIVGSLPILNDTMAAMDELEFRSSLGGWKAIQNQLQIQSTNGILTLSIREFYAPSGALIGFGECQLKDDVLIYKLTRLTEVAKATRENNNCCAVIAEMVVTNSISGGGSIIQ